MNPADLPIPQAAARLRDGRLTAIALARAYLERIAARNPALHAFVAVTAEPALAAAARADAELAAGQDRGPLHGIPIAVKDMIDVAGSATACGSRLRAGHRAARNAEVVRRLLQGGAVPLGKLATYEFALVGPTFDQPDPPAVNPRAPERITGGSSSGAAAAVAGGLLRTALGTDTGGSIRAPAGYCGVVGLKPTFGRVPRGGVVPLAPGLDHVGPISATVAEAALTLDAIADPGAPAAPAAAGLGRGIDGLRIAYARDWFARDPALDPAVLGAIDAAVEILARMGARIGTVAMPDHDLMHAAGAVMLQAEALALHRADLAASGPGYGRAAFRSLVSGICLTGEDLAAARRAGDYLRAEIDATLFACHDALVTATTLTPAPPLAAFHAGRPVWTPMRTLPFNLTGHPALALPAGSSDGMPLSLQIVGRAFDECRICRIGHALEAASRTNGPSV